MVYGRMKKRIDKIENFKKPIELTNIHFYKDKSTKLLKECFLGLLKIPVGLHSS